MADQTIKGVTAAQETFDGSNLRILVVHTRWNMQVIEPLVKGTLETLQKQGVKRDNILVENVSGSYELPLACSRLIAASQVQASANASDLMGTAMLDPLIEGNQAPQKQTSKKLTGPFNAVIAIGVLIKGSTMHFEYIADAVTHGLMRVGLDTGVPVIFGVLTCLTDEQALLRAGVAADGKEGHNHGIDWANAAVEQAVKTKRWAEGSI